MATKAPPKPAAKTAGTAVAKRASGSVVSIQEALKKQAAAMSDRIGSVSGININLKGKKFTLPDGRKTSDPLELVIVDFVSVNSFYDTDYDEKNPTPPACFAIGDVPLQLVPSKNSPVGQSSACKGCPMNEFGSKGEGKACANTRLLAVLPPDAAEDTPIWLLKVSPTGLKNFDGFVRSVSSTYQMPPVSVIATVSFNEDKAYPQLEFSNAVPNENLAMHYARQDEARKLLLAEPDVSSYVGPAPKKQARGGRR